MSGKEQITNIISPHANDVLSGRGGSNNKHAGNLAFTALVKKYKKSYVICPKSQKSMYSKQIYDEIRAWSPPGRFLKQDPNTRLWSDIGKKKALGKIRQALREGAPELLKVLETGGGHYDDLSASDISSIDQDNNIDALGHSVPEPPNAQSTKSLTNSSQKASPQRAPSLRAPRKKYMRFMSDVSFESSGSDSLLTLPIIPAVEHNENRKRPAPAPAHVPNQVNASSSISDTREEVAPGAQMLPVQVQGNQGRTMQQNSNATGGPEITLQVQAPNALSQHQSAYSQALQMTFNQAFNQAQHTRGGNSDTIRTAPTSLTNSESSNYTDTSTPANGINALITALRDYSATTSSLATTSNQSMTSESDDTPERTTSSFLANPSLFKTGISAPGQDINTFLAALSSNVATTNTETPQTATVSQRSRNEPLTSSSILSTTATNPLVSGMDALPATYGNNSTTASKTTSHSSSSSSNTEQLPQQTGTQRAQHILPMQPGNSAGKVNLTNPRLENSAAGNIDDINKDTTSQTQLLQYQLALQQLQAQMGNSLTVPGASHASSNSQQTGGLASSLTSNLNTYQQVQLAQTMILYQQIQGQHQQPLFETLSQQESNFVGTTDHMGMSDHNDSPDRQNHQSEQNQLE